MGARSDDGRAFRISFAIKHIENNAVSLYHTHMKGIICFILIIFHSCLPVIAQNLNSTANPNVSQKRLLQFHVTPSDKQACVKAKKVGESDFELWGNVDNQGNIVRYVPLGEYDYCITAVDYEEFVGRVTLSEGSITQVENVTLKTSFGLLEVQEPNGLEGAEIFVNDECIGTTPFRDASRHWAPGQYRIEVVGNELYSSYSSTFTINKGETTRVTPKLEANFSNITLTVAHNARINVDGKDVGHGSWTGKLKEGSHNVTCTLNNHHDVSQVITVTKGKTEKIQLPSPTPITGTLVVISNPLGATITIDGEPSGKTPKVFPDILIGHHTVKLNQASYITTTRDIDIAENEEQQLEVTMEDNGVGLVGNDYKINDENTITFTAKGVSFTMVYVEGGTFTMTSSSSQGDIINSTVSLSNYMIGQTEVTQALWEAVMGRSVTDIARENRWTCHGVGYNYPMYDVTWEECQTFVKKLNSLTGQNFRLPTEAEWEYAARGGKRSRGYKFSGSNSLGAVAWYSDNSYYKGASSPAYGAQAVKQKAPNELGLYDMSGNVGEWCQDWFGALSNHSSAKNPTGPSSGERHVIRGGAWFIGEWGCTNTYRNGYNSAVGHGYYGLRLALGKMGQ